MSQSSLVSKPFQMPPGDRNAQADCPLVTRFVPTENYTARRPETEPPRQPEMLILHYTAMASAARAVYWLTTPESGVSCHYLVTESGAVIQMVHEAHRAWHAGVSYWQGERDINSASIGIEIANPGPDGALAAEFPHSQMEAVRDLAADICQRNAIPRHRVLAHSDIAPGRKLDPGPLFDWEWLAGEGVGYWPGAITPTQASPSIADAQQRLSDIGYEIEATGCEDDRTRTVISAVQLHWRPRCYDGVLDAETAALIETVWGGTVGVS
ncbi:MAG: N-acetylmuramoyl-L-alanine amidase [Pseudomonadota bacterium]